MQTDSKVGLVVGLMLVVAVAVFFFMNKSAPQGPTAAVESARPAPTARPSAAALAPAPLARPSRDTPARPVSNLR
jgi:hypothetical protein